MGFLSGWDQYKRKKLTLDSSKVDSDLINIPIDWLVTDSSVFTELGSDANRKKIAITASDGTTEVNVEIVRWDHSAQKGYLKFNATSLSSSVDTIFYFYYDSSHSDNTAYVGDIGDIAAQAVYDSNVLSFYTLDQDPSGSAPQMLDSTSNDNHGTSNGTMTSGDLVDGQIGKALEFDGVDDFIQLGDDTLWDGVTELTISAWIKYDSTAPDDELHIVSDFKHSPDDESAFFRVIKSSEYITIAVSDGTTQDFIDTNNNTVLPNVFYHVVAVFDGGTSLSIYINGTLSKSAATAIASLDTENNPILIGKNGYIFGDTYYKGIIDQVSISNTVRSAAWIKAQYSSAKDELITISGAAPPVLPEQDMAQQVDFLLSGYHDNNGNALVGGKVYFYAPGTTDLQLIWDDADETTEATNPVELDPYGRALNGVFAKGLYDIKIDSSADVTIETISEVYYKVDVASSALTIASVSSTPYSASSTGKLLLVNSAGENIIVDLLSAATHGGEVIEIFKTSASNTVTVTPDGSETINGAATFVLTDNYGFVKIRSDGTNWAVLSTNQGTLSFTGDLSVTGNITASGNITAVGNLSAASISSLTTPLAANKGGTGQSSYTIGDLLYASSTSALSKLAKGADGEILQMISGDLTWNSLSSAAIARSGNNTDINSLAPTGNILKFGGSTKLSSGNETAPDVDAGGLTLKHASGADGYLRTLKKADCSHGMTDQAEDDTYLTEETFSGSDGWNAKGYAASSTAVHLRSNVGTEDTAAPSGSSVAGTILGSSLKSGTTIGSHAAAANLVLIRNLATAVWMVQGDGDVRYAGAASAFDDYDDALACRDLSYVLSGKEYFSKIIKHNAQKLHDMKVITFTPAKKSKTKKDEFFVSTKGMNGLMLGAIGELLGVVDLALNKIGMDYTTLKNEFRQGQLKGA